MTRPAARSRWWDDRASRRITPTHYRSPIVAPVKGVARLMLWLFGALVAFALVMACTSAKAQTIPREAQQHRATLKREAQRVWGLNAPIATFAAQIHQESRWRADARSPVGAVGLAQFMPSTADWIGGVYVDLRERAPMNPTWAIRGLVTYDKWLADRISADTPCDEMAFVLSAFNGGLGWVYKRQRLSLQPGVCIGATCSINPGVTTASQRENQHYPEVILLRFEPLYRAWGRGSCS